MITIDYLLKRTANKYPKKEALVCDSKRISYEQFDQRANRLGNALTSWGVEKGDRVALLLYNSRELAEGIFGIARAGAIGVPLNYRLKPNELAYILNHSGSKVLLYGSEFSEQALPLHKLTELEKFICIEGSGPDIGYEELLSQFSGTSPPFKIGEDDPAALLYTSGTTGRPKGVVITHRNQIWACVSQTIEYGVTHRDRVLITAPMFHTGAFSRFLTAVYLGNSIFILKQFDPVKFLQLVETEEITFTSLVPTMFIMVDQLPQEVKRSFQTTSVEKYITSGSILPVELVRKIQNLFPRAQIRDSYGATEFNFTTVLQPEDFLRKIGSVGRAHVNSEVRILNDRGTEMSPGEVGEICVRGPHVMKEYYRDPEATREAFTEGWFRTGDLGRMDAEGFFYIVDRKKDMIISGGENIYPREIEEVLYTHEKIAEAAVIGVPDSIWGESVRAIVVTKPGERLTEGEVINFCAQRLAGYKKPKSVIFVDFLPKNTSSKILKKTLKEQFGKL